jgi:hypothetical protein
MWLLHKNSCGYNEFYQHIEIWRLLKLRGNKPEETGQVEYGVGYGLE